MSFGFPLILFAGSPSWYMPSQKTLCLLSTDRPHGVYLEQVQSVVILQPRPIEQRSRTLTSANAFNCHRCKAKNRIKFDHQLNWFV